MITSNHVHILVSDNAKNRKTIPNSIKLIAGRTAQEYNKRKKRKGAFWEDRYHATAVQDTEYLIRCMNYIDMNMVRAGVVKKPSDWEFCGLHEILSPKKRYAIIDHKRILELLNFDDFTVFKKTYLDWLGSSLNNNQKRRETKWTQSVAVGSHDFIKTVKDRLGARALGRRIENNTGTYELRETLEPYGDFKVKNDGIEMKNLHLWDSETE